MLYSIAFKKNNNALYDIIFDFKEKKQNIYNLRSLTRIKNKKNKNKNKKTNFND